MGGWMKEGRAAGMWEGMWCSYHNSWNVSDRDVPNQWFSRWGPRPTAYALPENLLEMQIWTPCPRPIESETLGVGPSTPCFNKSSRWFWPRFKFENHGCGLVSFYRWQTKTRSLGLTCLNSHILSVTQPGHQSYSLCPCHPTSLPHFIWPFLFVIKRNHAFVKPFQSPGIESPLLWSFWFHWGFFQNLEKKKCDLELFL